MLNWYETKIKYEKTAKEGKIVKVSESYLVDALTFTEAENRINEEMKPFISGKFIVDSIRRARINELFVNENGDKWYKCKVYFIALDEEKGIEKKTTTTMYVQANDTNEAEINLKEGMKGSMANYEISSIVETKILDVFPFISKEIPEIKATENNSINNNEIDPLLKDAALLILENNNASVSLIQRKFSLGYNRAGRIMDSLEKIGVVGCFLGVKSRDILVSVEQLKSMNI